MNLKKIMLNNYLYLVIFFSFSFTNQVGFGNEIFKENYAARNAALGGTSLYITGSNNPSNLVNHSSSFLDFSFMNKFGGLAKVNSISYLKIKEDDSPIFISLIHRIVKDIPDTRAAWLDNGDFIVDQSEINYFNIKTFSQNEIGIKFSFLKKIKQATFASSLKPSYSSLSGYRSFGFSLDFSVLKQFFNDKIDFSLQAQDILNFKYWSTKYKEYSYPTVAIGGNLDLNRFLICFDIKSQFGDSPKLNYNLGIEILQSNEILILRFGKSSKSLFTIGAGIELNSFNIDYAFISHSSDKPFEPSQILSVSLKFKTNNWIKSKLSP